MTMWARRFSGQPNSVPHNHISVVGGNLDRLIKCGVVAAGLAASAAPAKAEYLVSRGDVLEVAVAGVSELKFRAPVQMDGSISLPIVGTLPAAGLPVQQIRANVAAALASKVFRQRTSDGREVVVVIDADAITATMAEYRPVYVNGDVSKPGEYPYRPAITGGQVVALAGGYDVMHMRMNNPYLEAADLRSEYGTLWTEFTKERTRIWRIKNELGEESSTMDPAVLKDVPIPSSVISEIVQSESDYLRTKLGDYQREKAYLQRSLREGEDEVKVLSSQQKAEDEAYQADQDELQKVLDLFGKGSLVSTRVTDARRALLLSSTRKLQTTAQLMQVKKQNEETSRKLEKLDDQRRIDLLRELQTASVNLSETRGKLQSVGEKLQYTAMIRSQLIHRAVGKPGITIVRKGEKGFERIVASEDTELQPGDTIEVTLPDLDGADGSPTRLSESNSPSAARATLATANSSPRIGSR